MQLNPHAELLEKVRAFAQSASVREGCLLYDLEFVSTPNGRVLRIYIDRDQGLVSLDDCANVSRELNTLLDADQNLIPGESYDLEVSSPGVERRLIVDWHFQRAVGQPVRITTMKATNGGHEGVTPQTLLDGTLLKIENETLTIRKDERDWAVPLNLVSKAHVRLESATQHPKGKKKR